MCFLCILAHDFLFSGRFHAMSPQSASCILGISDFTMKCNLYWHLRVCGFNGVLSWMTGFANQKQPLHQHWYRSRGSGNIKQRYHQDFSIMSHLPLCNLVISGCLYWYFTKLLLKTDTNVHFCLQLGLAMSTKLKKNTPAEYDKSKQYQIVMHAIWYDVTFILRGRLKSLA